MHEDVFQADHFAPRQLRMLAAILLVARAQPFSKDGQQPLDDEAGRFGIGVGCLVEAFGVVDDPRTACSMSCSAAGTRSMGCIDQLGLSERVGLNVWVDDFLWLDQVNRQAQHALDLFLQIKIACEREKGAWLKLV